MANWSHFVSFRKGSVPQFPYFPNCGQVGSCPFARALQEKMDQESQLEQKNHALSLRERAAAQEEARLKKEKNILQEERQRLARQRDQLLREQKELKKQQEQLLLRSTQIAGREDSLKQREDQLLRDRGALIIRERQTQTQESALTDRACQLARLEDEIRAAGSALETQAQTCRRERQEWEEMKASFRSGSDPSREMRDVKDAFLGISAELKTTQAKLRDLLVTVDRSSRDGVVALCRLSREMGFSADPQIQLLARKLEMLLQMGFDAVPLEPQAGEEYDSTRHERMDMTRRGTRITACRAAGWLWRDEVLMRSVVETNEKDVTV